MTKVYKRTKAAAKKITRRRALAKTDGNMVRRAENRGSAPLDRLVAAHAEAKRAQKEAEEAAKTAAAALILELNERKLKSYGSEAHGLNVTVVEKRVYPTISGTWKDDYDVHNTKAKAVMKEWKHDCDMEGRTDVVPSHILVKEIKGEEDQ